MGDDEKKAIEKATAEAFLALFNRLHQTSFRPIEYGDAPDVRCSDADGAPLNLEITLTQDGSTDIQYLLGRHSKNPFLERLKQWVREVDLGKRDPTGRPPELDIATNRLVGAIAVKFRKDYGPACALVVRDVSTHGWPWEEEVQKIRAALDLSRHPFDRGFWVLSAGKTRLARIA